MPWKALFCLAVLCSAAGALENPKIRPAVSSIVPLGGQRGSSFEVTLHGANLQSTERIEFAIAGASAEVLETGYSHVRARITLDANVEPGRHDLRAVTPRGSTIHWFDAGVRPETAEAEPNDSFATAQPLELPALVNGIVSARDDFDHYRFEAEAGETMSFDVVATRAGGRLDPILSLHDAQGRELAFSDDYYAFKDPHFVYTFERGGEYFLRVYAAEYAGPTAAYRLMAGPLPYAYHAMPSGARRGTAVEFELTGVNLSQIGGVVLGGGLAKGEVIEASDRSARVRLGIPADAPLGPLRLHIEGAMLPVPFVVSDFAERTVSPGTARSMRGAVAVRLPAVVNGLIDRPKAADYFAFEIDGPKRILAAADSMQLGFLLDPLVAIYDESGARLAYQDEPTTNTGKEPANLDPHLTVELPKAGRYIAMVRDSQFRGEHTFAYRLTIKEAEPDFTLTVIGTDETLFRGKENVVTVRVRRLEGWDEPVELWAENLPPGVTARPVMVEPVNTPYKGTCGEPHVLDGTNAELRLEVGPGAPDAYHPIVIRGRGVAAGRTVERVAHTRYWWGGKQKARGLSETRDMVVTIQDTPGAVLDAPVRLTLAPGERGRIKVTANRFDGGVTPLDIAAAQTEGLTVEPVTLPPGAKLAEIEVSRTGGAPATLVLTASAGGKELGRSHPIEVSGNEVKK